jgi:hypothetical protein
MLGADIEAQFDNAVEILGNQQIFLGKSLQKAAFF